MLVSPEEMGTRFKFLALLNNNCKHSPVGFDPLPEDKTEGAKTEENKPEGQPS